MKRILFPFFCVLGAVSAFALSPANEQFLTGYGVVVSNNVTVVWNQANVPAFDPPQLGGAYSGQPSKLFYSLTSSNMAPTVVSNSTSGFSPGTLYWTNNGVFSSTAPLTGGIVINTNVTQPVAWSDVAAWPNVNGDVSQAALNVTAASFNGTATNTMSFTFAGVANGTNDDQTFKFVFTVPVTGANGASTTLKTNIPNALLQGAMRLRLVSIATTNTTGGTAQTILVSHVSLSGWKP